ncbi:unnamed protein product [Lampetra fluviatilis]
MHPGAMRVPALARRRRVEAMRQAPAPRAGGWAEVDCRQRAKPPCPVGGGARAEIVHGEITQPPPTAPGAVPAPRLDLGSPWPRATRRNFRLCSTPTRGGVNTSTRGGVNTELAARVRAQRLRQERRRRRHHRGAGLAASVAEHSPKRLNVKRPATLINVVMDEIIYVS